MKKIIAFLFAVFMAFSLIGCSLTVDNIKPLKLSEKGVKVKSIDDITDWTQEKADEVDDYLDKNKKEKGRWFSFTSEYAGENDGEDGEYYKSSAKITGKIYASPYAYECKYSLNVTANTEEATRNDDDKLEKTTTSITSKIIYIHGNTYAKTKTVTKTEEGKTTETTYANESFFDDSLKSIIPSLAEVLDFSEGGIAEITYYLEHGDIYLSDKGVEIEVNDKSSYNGESSSSLMQVIVKLTNDSEHIKSFETYISQSSKSYESVEKTSIKPALFGIVNRPSDYYRYEYED